MQNHVTNIVTIETETEDTKTIFASLKTDKSEFDFNSIIPMPEELKDTTSPSKKPNKDLIEKYGYDNWYDWSIKNWGTKWNAYDIEVENWNKLRFDTAWSCANQVIDKLSRLHPEVDFKLTYADEDTGYNCGIITYKNGEQSYTDMSVSAQDEETALRWAMTVKYGSDDDYDEWYGEDQED